MSKSDYINEDIIILRSVYGKVVKYFIQPCKNPQTGLYPDCVKPVTSAGDIILSDAERASGKPWIKETETFVIVDGATFDLSKPHEKARWEAIEHCNYIAPSRFAKDERGQLLSGGKVYGEHKPRCGVAELYIEKPGEESAQRVTRKMKLIDAAMRIKEDSEEGRRKMARILGKHVVGMPLSDVTDYLFELAERDPDKIINLYTGGDTKLRVLLMDARDKKVIYVKNKLYYFADDVILGATDDAAIAWLKDSRNNKLLKLITNETYPELIPDDSKK